MEAYFGTVEGRRASLAIRGRAEDEAGPSKGPRKHGRNGITNGLSLDLPVNGPLPKRSRRSETQASTNGDSMQIDQNGYHDRQENGTSSNNYSPADNVSANGMEIDEQPATPTPEPTFTLTNGESRGIQSEKPVDLTDKASIQTLSSSIQAIMHLAYNPQDPTIIAAGGEALARIWQTPKTAGTTDSTQNYQDILPPTNDSLVSSMAWSPDGEYLAVASHHASSPDCAGAVSIWTKHGKCMEELPATQEMVILLQWNPTSTQLLGMSSSGTMRSSITVWDLNDLRHLAPCQIDHELRDVVWLDDNQFAVCGHGIVGTSYSPVPEAIAVNPSRDNEIHIRVWNLVRHNAPLSANLFAADETGGLALLNHNSEVMSVRQAHEAEITALEFQPLDEIVEYHHDTHRLLATCSLDGTVKIWNSKNIECLNALSLGGVSYPAMALSFTPDGHLLAAANPNRILVWNPEDKGPPKASWRGDLGRSPKKGLLTNGNGMINGNGDIPMDRDSAIGDDAEDEGCSLSWDAEGTKLAMGSGSQVCYSISHVPNFLRGNMLILHGNSVRHHQLRTLIGLAPATSIYTHLQAFGKGSHMRQAPECFSYLASIGKRPANTTGLCSTIRAGIYHQDSEDSSAPLRSRE